MAREKTPAVEKLEEALRNRTAEGALYERLHGDAVRCHACAHRCRIPSGQDGVCRVRFNEGGVLRVPRGYVAGLAVDPIEKKPFFHALPGADALSFGMLGCDLHCPYCQNWISSQTLRDADALSAPRDIGAEEIVASGRAHGTPVVVSTYNEPLITSEWAVEVFRLAKAEGMACGYVSNGHATPEVLEYLRPWVDLFKVDLKSFRESAYRELGGKLEAVLDTLRRLHGMGFWVEVVTLLVPGFNDSEEELRGLTGFLASVSPDIPWHVTAFHRDYRMDGPRGTSADDLLRAVALGREEGLRFVYAGNLPGRVAGLENTLCPSCGALLVERRGFAVVRDLVGRAGACPRCGAAIPGFWKLPAA